MAPAPTPLSMFTTASPGLQLCSIPMQRRLAAAAEAVPVRGRQADHRHGDEAGDDGGQSALHAGGDDQRTDAGGAHLLERPRQAVQAGDAHVEGGQGVDLHGPDHRDGLAGDGDVAGAGREDADRAARLRRRRVRAAHDHDTAARVVLHGARR